jgi:colanic acid biosynthesis glycosyl transferase WcaI
VSKPPGRVLFLSPYLLPESGAAPVRVASTADAMAKLGWDVRVCTGMPNYPEGITQVEYRTALFRSETRPSGVRVRRIRTVAGGGRGYRRYLNFVSSAAVSVAPVFWRWKPDIVIAETPPPTQFLSAWLVSRRWNATLVSSVADLWPETAIRLGFLQRKSPIVRLATRLECLVYQRSDKLIAITESIASHLVDHAKRLPDDILMVRNGVDTDLFRPGTPSPEVLDRFGSQHRPYLLYAGSLGVPTEPAVLVHLADELAGDNIDLVVLGAGSEASIVADAVAGRSNLRYFPSQSLELVAELYRGCLAGVVTLAPDPFFEGTLPAKLLPIMGTGVPVLYAGSGEAARLVRESKCGFVAASGDAATLASGARTLRENDDLRVRLGRNARDFAETHLSWTAVAVRMTQFLE